MGRTVVLEESEVPQQIKLLQKSSDPVIGLIVGQRARDSQIYVVSLVATPEGEDEADQQTPRKTDDGKSKGKNAAGDASTTFVATLDPSLVEEHARQVSRMLPGAVDIIGVFSYLTQTVFDAKQSELRSLLNVVAAASTVTHDHSCKDRLLFNICPQTTVQTMRLYDTSPFSGKQNGTSVTVKQSEFVGKWLTVTTDVTVNGSGVFPNGASHTQLVSLIDSTLDPICEQYENSMGTIEGHVVNGAKALSSVHSKSDSGRKKTEFSAQLFVPLTRKDQPKDKTVRSKALCAVSIHGHVHGLAYVHHKATVDEALSAVRADLVRSLRARFHLFCEDVCAQEEEEEEHDVSRRRNPSRKEFHVGTPRRVVCAFAGPIKASDYVLTADGIESSQERFTTMLGVISTPEFIEGEQDMKLLESLMARARRRAQDGPTPADTAGRVSSSSASAAESSPSSSSAASAVSNRSTKRSASKPPLSDHDGPAPSIATSPLCAGFMALVASAAWLVFNGWFE